MSDVQDDEVGGELDTNGNLYYYDGSLQRPQADRASTTFNCFHDMSDGRILEYARTQQVVQTSLCMRKSRTLGHVISLKQHQDAWRIQ